jgi:hypothetical protein
MASKKVEGSDGTTVLSNGLARIVGIESLPDHRPAKDERHVLVTYRTTAGANSVVMAAKLANRLGLHASLYTGSLVRLPKQLQRSA